MRPITNECTMDILLQNTETGEFLDGNGHWTQAHQSARRFASGHEALTFCQAHALKHARLRYEFPNPKMNFSESVING